MSKKEALPKVAYARWVKDDEASYAEFSPEVGDLLDSAGTDREIIGVYHLHELVIADRTTQLRPAKTKTKT